jgi:hypothetical protein
MTVSHLRHLRDDGYGHLCWRDSTNVETDRSVNPLYLGIVPAVRLEASYSGAVGATASHGSDVSDRGGSYLREHWIFETSVVIHQCDVRTGVKFMLGKEDVGPADDEIVNIRESFSRRPYGSRVNDDDPETKRLGEDSQWLAHMSRTKDDQDGWWSDG